MDKKQYEENARKIIDLVDGMEECQWCKIQHLIGRCFDEKKVKVVFEKPEHLDLLMKQNLILDDLPEVSINPREFGKFARQAVPTTAHDSGGYNR